MSTTIAPAKINLNLLLTGRRDDGYHLLESDVVFTEFGDNLSFAPSDHDAIEIIGPYGDGLGTANNLCLQALAAFRAAGGIIGPIKITLTKNIPVGAGLGGGSADAAATLRYLAAQTNSPHMSSDLAAIALLLGADVPVCLHSNSQHMSGIGEVLRPIAQSTTPAPAQTISGTPILLANPNKPLATIDVFKAYAAANQPFSDIVSNSGFTAAADFVALGNDLDQAAMTIMPEIAQLLQDIKTQSGVRAAAMSGSGASCFGLFDSDANCQNAAKILTDSGYWAVASVII